MRRLTLLAAVAATCALAPASASAAPGWTSPFTLPGAGAPPWPEGLLGTRIGALTDGTLLAARAELVSESPLATRVVVYRRPPAGAWTPELVINSVPDSAYPAGATLAVAANGRAVLGFEEAADLTVSPPPVRMRAVSRAPDGTWGTPQTLATLKEVQFVGAAVNPSGAMALAIRERQPDPSVASADVDYWVRAATRDAGGDWTAPDKLSPDKKDADDINVAIDPDGTTTVAWAQREEKLGSSYTKRDDRYEVRLRRHTPGAPAFNAAENPATAYVGEFVDDVRLAVGPSGRGVLAFGLRHPTDEVQRRWYTAVRDTPNVPWPQAEAIDHLGASSAVRAVGVAPDGSVYVLGDRYSFGSARAVLARRSGLSGWSVFPVGSDNINTDSGMIGFRGNDAFAAWEGFTVGDNSRILQAVRWPAAAPQPDAFRDLEPVTGSPTLGGIVGDNDGSVLIHWLPPNSSAPRVIVYDGGAPRLRTASVPATATAGVASRMSATFADAWSAVGQPRWSFGDGASATGATVSHAWAAPGPYTVTVSAADQFGNERTRTFDVQVRSVGGPPPPDAAPKVTLKLVACKRKEPARRCRSRKRLLQGSVNKPAVVQVAVFRKAGKRYRYLAKGRFKLGTKVKARRSFTRAKVSGRNWRLQLPKLSPGRWTVTVRATDKAGKRSRTVTKRLSVR